jgi:hypothetical protein
MPNDLVNALPQAVNTLCRTPRELLSVDARPIIARLCRGFLDQAKLTPTELLYIPRHQAAFLAAGTLYQTAVQKIAIAQTQAETTQQTPQARIREIYEMVDQTISGEAARQEANPPPAIAPETFAEFLAGLAGLTPEQRDDAIYSALALHLDGIDSWSEKVTRLLRLAPAAKAAGLLAPIDVALSEVLDFPMALRDALGATPTLGDMIRAIIELARGKMPKLPAATIDVPALATLLDDNSMPQTRGALVRQLQRGIATGQKLTAGGAHAELVAAMTLRGTVLAAGHTLGGEMTLEALDKRLAPLMIPEELHAAMTGIARLDERARFLFIIHRDLGDSRYRPQVRKYIDFLFDQEKLILRLTKEELPPLQKLRRIAELHDVAARCGLAQAQSDKYTRALESAEADIIRALKLFERVENEGANVAARAVRLIDLWTTGIFTRVTRNREAQPRLKRYLQDPDFHSSYLDGVPANDRESKIAELHAKLSAIGVRTEFAA